MLREHDGSADVNYNISTDVDDENNSTVDFTDQNLWIFALYAVDPGLILSIPEDLLS